MMPQLRSLFHDRVAPRLNRHRSTPLQRRRPSFENLEQRMMLAATLINTPTWLERGPGPIMNSGNVDLTGNGSGGDLGDVAVGAIEAIAVDPADSKHVFVGTVNGGIWETNDVNAASPVWTTTTDQLPSLAISAIAISPVNSNRVYAGTGSFSSGGLEGGKPVGLYRSFDGGTTWTNIGFDTFNGMHIRSIIPTQLNGGGTIFVATTDSRGVGTGGIYRSNDFGITWQRMSGANGTGLPDAAVSHLTSFAVNSSTVGFYTAVIGTGGGIFRSMNNGQTWQSITNNIATSVASARRIEFSVSPAGTKPVYAMLVEQVGSTLRLLNVFRSSQGTDGVNNNHAGGIDEPAEATWQAIAATPPDLGPQGGIHFAILADSTLNNIVYVGGSVSSGNSRGNLFRGNSTTRAWTSLTETGANNTSPHPDARDLVFSGANILRADDGGIYRLLDPRGLTIEPTKWQSANGNLRNSEIISVALDNRNNTNLADDIVLAGVFDNGSSERSAAGQWAQVIPGDGGTVQASDTGTPVHYFTDQHLEHFVKRVGDGLIGDVPRFIDPAQMPPDTVVFPSLDSFFDPDLPFLVPYQVHASDPNRILVGSVARLYESLNGGFTVSSLGGISDSGDPLPVPGLTGTVLSMAYGHADNPDLAYVGTNSGDIFVRTEGSGASSGPFVRTNFFASSSEEPLDIVVDAINPQRAYAVTASGVFMTSNVMDWVSITDDLNALALPGSGINLRSIELVNDDTPSLADDVILVGGLGGVFRRRVAATAGPKWSEYGRGLPNALVMDMEYDERSDTLLVGTLGRSTWTLKGVRSTIALESQLQVVGTSGHDTIRLVRNANNPSLLDVFFNNSTTTPSLTAQLSVVQRIQVTGGSGPDVLEIQSTNGIVSVQNGIDFAGGNDSSLDQLILRNTTDTVSRVGQFSAGGIKSSLTGPLTFSGIEAVSIFFGSGSDNFDATLATMPVTLIGGPGTDTLRGGMGDDTLDSRDGISGNDQLFGGPGNDTALMDPGDFFNGGPDEDGIHFFGTPGNDEIRISRQVGPDGAQALVEQKKQVQVFNYVEGETITVFAGAGNDRVTVDASVTTWRAELFGEKGNDRLVGGPLDDLLNGGPGNDYLDGGAGDNVLIGGGGKDVLRNGHAPLVAQAALATTSAASTSRGTSTNSISASLVQSPVQQDNRSQQLGLNHIELNRAALAELFLQRSESNTSRSRAILLETNKFSNGVDDELLGALISGNLSTEDSLIPATMDSAFATYGSTTRA